MKKLVILALLACWLLPATAQLTRWQAGAAHVGMGKQVSVLEDKQGTLTIDDVTRATFEPSTQSILHFGFTKSIFWLHFTLDNTTTDSLLLELDHAFIPTADLYTQDNHGHFTRQQAGYQIPLKKKPIVNAAQVFQLPSGHHDFYLRLQPYVHAIPVTLWEKSSFHLQASREKLYYGIYVGLLLFAIAINIFLFYTFRRRYYLQYALLVFLYIMSSALVMEGYAVYFFPETDLMFWYRLVPVLDMPALLFYVLAFLEVKKYDPRLYKVTAWIGASLLAYIAVLEFLPLIPVLVVNQVLAISTFVLAILIGTRTGRRGNKLGYYFVAAYLIWFVLINMELVYIQTGTPPHLGSISYVSLAIFIESFLLAYLLIQRFRWEKQEDQRRQADMQAHINKMHREFQHAILSSKLEIQEQTFQQISQEIHDNIGQILSLVKLHVATMDAGGNPVLENKIKDSKTLVTKAIHDLRSLSHRLNTGYINDVGFDIAVRGEMETIKRSGVYDTKFTIEGRPTRFDPQKELILFRIVQELLNNILKHAKAKIISVELNYNREGLLVMVQDDGQGFDRAVLEQQAAGVRTPVGQATADTGSGLGIKSMYHRASLIGADFQLTSAVGAGTVAAIHIAHPAPGTRKNPQPATKNTSTL